MGEVVNAEQTLHVFYTYHKRAKPFRRVNALYYRQCKFSSLSRCACVGSPCPRGFKVVLESVHASATWNSYCSEMNSSHFIVGMCEGKCGLSP